MAIKFADAGGAKKAWLKAEAWLKKANFAHKKYISA